MLPDARRRRIGWFNCSASSEQHQIPAKNPSRRKQLGFFHVGGCSNGKVSEWRWAAHESTCKSLELCFISHQSRNGRNLRGRVLDFHENLGPTPNR
jgi:hypothetical protein